MTLPILSKADEISGLKMLNQKLVEQLTAALAEIVRLKTEMKMKP